MQYVDVPSGFEDVFAKAERYVGAYFEDRRFTPEDGEVTIGGIRYVLIRAQALSKHFTQSLKHLYADQGPEVVEVGRAVLYELARNMGRADAEAFRNAMDVEDPIGQLSSGPVHFAFAGWGRVSILPESNPSPDEAFLLVYEHPNSFESDAWLGSDEQSETPVCLMNAGYSAGWCEVAFGLKLVAVEISCRACGDDQCRFVMAPPDQIADRLTELGMVARGTTDSMDQLPAFQQLHALTEVVHDLSRQRDALEKQLSHEEQRVADLVEHAHDVIQSVDMEGRYEFVNRRWHELLGYDDDELSRLNVFDVIRPDHREPCRKMFAQLSAGQPLCNVETVFLTKDGREVAVEGNVSLKTEGGRPVSTRGIFRDVTAQEAAKQKMDNLLARTRSVLENAPVGILLYDMTGRCIEANDTAGASIGATRDQVLTQNFRRLASWRQSGMLVKAERCIARGEAGEHEAWLDTGFGRRVCLHSRFVPLTLDGKPHVLVLTEDVTAARQGEEAQLAYQNRLLHVHQLALDIANSNNLDDVLQTAIDGCTGLAAADLGAIVVLDPATGKPSGVHACQYPMEEVPPGTELEGRGMLGVIAGGHAVHSDDVSTEPSFVGLPEWHPEIEAALGIPVSDRGATVAMLLLARRPGGLPFTDEDQALVETVASLLAIAIRTARQFEQLAELNDKLEQIATTDALMQVANRRSFDDEVVRFHSGARRYDKPYAVLMVDVDHFKRYTDRYGHPAGDRALARVAELLSGAIRAEDRIFRYGGEELVLLMPQQLEEGIAAAAERLRVLVEGDQIAHEASELGVLTLSMGGAVYHPRGKGAGQLSWQDIVKRADEALYRAKEEGRNRVVVAPAEP